MDLLRGLARFFGHFVIFAAVPNMAAVIAQEWGVSIVYFRALPWLLAPTGVLLIYSYERRDYHNKRNGWRKGILDFISKGLGWVVGLGTWLAWWV